MSGLWKSPSPPTASFPTHGIGDSTAFQPLSLLGEFPCPAAPAKTLCKRLALPSVWSGRRVSFSKLTTSKKANSYFATFANHITAPKQTYIYILIYHSFSQLLQLGCCREKNVQCAPSKCRSELAEGDRSSNQFPLRISIDIVSWDSRLTFQQAKLNVNKPFLADQTTLILGKKALRAAMFSG